MFQCSLNVETHCFPKKCFILSTEVDMMMTCDVVDIFPFQTIVSFFQELRDDMPSILADVFSILGKFEFLF